MKKCPKCGKVYDDSWKMCLNCSVVLSEDISIVETNPELEVKRAKGSILDFSFWAKNKKEGENAVKVASIVCCIVAAIRISFAIAGGQYRAIPANLILPAFAIAFYITKSRIISVVLFLLSILGSITNISGWEMLSNILPLIMIPAMRGAFVCHKKIETPEARK